MGKYIEIEEELLWALYWGEDMSTRDIAKIFNCSQTTIRDKMVKYNITRRESIPSHTIHIEPELLKSLYYGNEYSIKKLTKIFDCEATTIHNKLNKYNIKRRINSCKWDEDDYRRKEMSDRQKGTIPWNKGLTKETDERVALISNKLTGIIRSAETRKKISKAGIGRVFSEETLKKRADKLRKPRDDKWYNTKCCFCGKKIHKRQYQLDRNEYHFCDDKCQNEWQKNYFSGEGGSGWIDGRSFEPYPIEFNDKLKEKIRERDGYACQECKMTQDELGYSLSVHHIDYDKNNCSEDNLISLCQSCHIKTNWNRNNWIEYYKSKSHSRYKE
jgi:transposase